MPQVASADDTSNFNDDDFADRPPVLETTEPRRKTAFSGHHLPFVGFSFNPAFHPQAKAANGHHHHHGSAGSGADASRIAALEAQLAAAKAGATPAGAEKELQRLHSGPAQQAVWVRRALTRSGRLDTRWLGPPACASGSPSWRLSGPRPLRR